MQQEKLKTKTFTKEEIDTLFETATEQRDYVIGYYKALYGADWDRIDHIDDFVHAGQELADYYTEKAINWDKEHLEKRVLPGGAALNYGPAADKNLGPWQASIPAAIWKEEPDEQNNR